MLFLNAILRRAVHDSDSKVRELQAEPTGEGLATTGFADVAGIDEAKAQVEEVISIMRNPDVYADFGARVPVGILLVGPPGTGKTLLARASAAEVGVPFISVAGTEFVEVFAGRGAARIREVFEHARKVAPCIVFIDEIDTIGISRSSSIQASSGSSREADQTLNQLLVSMDGLRSRADGRAVVVMAATNRHQVLDEALLRPGRFDRIAWLNLPDAQGRLEILLTHIHLKQVPLSADADSASLANLMEKCEGMCGADLELLVNEAAIRAARRCLLLASQKHLQSIVNETSVNQDISPTVNMDDFEAALSDYTSSRIME